MDGSCNSRGFFLKGNDVRFSASGVIIITTIDNGGPETIRNTIRRANNGLVLLKRAGHVQSPW